MPEVDSVSGGFHTCRAKEKRINQFGRLSRMFGHVETYLQRWSKNLHLQPLSCPACQGKAQAAWSHSPWRRRRRGEGSREKEHEQPQRAEWKSDESHHPNTCWKFHEQHHDIHYLLFIVIYHNLGFVSYHLHTDFSVWFSISIKHTSTSHGHAEN